MNIHQKLYGLRYHISELEKRINASRDNFVREELASSLREEKRKLDKLINKER
jgi:hypothetical protein